MAHGNKRVKRTNAVLSVICYSSSDPNNSKVVVYPVVCASGVPMVPLGIPTLPILVDDSSGDELATAFQQVIRLWQVNVSPSPSPLIPGNRISKQNETKEQKLPPLSP